VRGGNKRRPARARRVCSIGRTDRHIGISRIDERQIDSTIAGSAVPALIPPKKMTCAGPAQIRNVEATAAPNGKPAPRASRPLRSSR
jgi:hypothetical protein